MELGQELCACHRSSGAGVTCLSDVGSGSQPPRSLFKQGPWWWPGFPFELEYLASITPGYVGFGTLCYSFDPPMSQWGGPPVILGAEMLREPWPIQKVFMAPGQIFVCDGPAFAKGSQEKIKNTWWLLNCLSKR